MEGKAVFGGGQGKGGEADNKLNIDSIIARLLEGDLHSQNYFTQTTRNRIKFQIWVQLVDSENSRIQHNSNDIPTCCNSAPSLAVH